MRNIGNDEIFLMDAKSAKIEFSKKLAQFFLNYKLPPAIFKHAMTCTKVRRHLPNDKTNSLKF